MRVTVFTSNQPRHIALIEGLATIADEVFSIQECNTVFPGRVEDFFKKSDVMRRYFNYVIEAERSVFGYPRFLPANVRSLSLKAGDLSKLDISLLRPALQSDYYIVFGSSFIRGKLIDFLINHKAVNIHMGVSPYYRGSSCNFWALYDRKPCYVGATIHLLSKGLDSGPILFHALPKAQEIEPFLLGMQAVRSAHEGLLDALKTRQVFKFEASPQNKDLEIRYTSNKDFNDDVALNYLEHVPTKQEIFQSLKNRNLAFFLNPHVL